MSHSMLLQQMDFFELGKYINSKIEAFFQVMITIYYLQVMEDKHKNLAREQHITLRDEFFSHLLIVVCVFFVAFHKFLCTYFASFPNNVFHQGNKLEHLY